MQPKKGRLDVIKHEVLTSNTRRKIFLRAGKLYVHNGRKWEVHKYVS